MFETIVVLEVVALFETIVVLEVVALIILVNDLTGPKGLNVNR